MTHVASYYAATSHPSPPRPALVGDVTADVCVIGGGIAGCGAALELAERGYRVVLLEARQVGWGASGRSGGQAIFGFGTDQSKIEAEVGRDTAKALWDISIDALDWVRTRVARHAIDCDLQWGHVHAALKERQRRDLQHLQQELEDTYNYRSLRFMERDELRELVATERYIAGLYDSGSGHLHPLNYTLGLAAAAESAGARLCEGSAVTRVETGDPLRIHTPQGCVTARFAVLARGGYVEGLGMRSDWRIMPVGTYVCATEVLGEARLRELLRRNVAVADVNFVLDYFRCSADHRLLFGGRVSYAGIREHDTGQATRARMVQVFPQLAATKLDYVWGGFVDISMSRAPDFGRLAPNVYYLQGFSGHGIAMAGMAGRLAAEAIAGQSERFDLFGKLTHRVFPGGRSLRTPALVLGMLWYRLKDLL